MKPYCRERGECVFRNEKCECRILDDCVFKHKACPFRKDKQKLRQDIFVEKDAEFKRLYKHYLNTCMEKGYKR